MPNTYTMTKAQQAKVVAELLLHGSKPQHVFANNFEHVSLINKDGTPLRARRTGKTHTWKTRPTQFSIPVKHGLRDCFYITEKNVTQWRIVN